MSDGRANKAKPWCIVVADDHGPAYVPWVAGAAKTSPVQYCGFGEPTTLLQRAFHRAEGSGCCQVPRSELPALSAAALLLSSASVRHDWMLIRLFQWAALACRS